MPDPAAAPLGTDAEAAGTPPTPRERAIEASAMSENAASNTPSRPGRSLYIGAIVVLAVLLLAIILVARS